MSILDLHESLLKVVVQLPSDYEPWGQRQRDNGDCSCGCRHFAALKGELGHDWGVCVNPNGPRFGLLTFEHQGCPQFEPDDASGEE